jgi:hypothetical protein
MKDLEGGLPVAHDGLRRLVASKVSHVSGGDSECVKGAGRHHDGRRIAAVVFRANDGFRLATDESSRRGSRVSAHRTCSLKPCTCWVRARLNRSLGNDFSDWPGLMRVPTATSRRLSSSTFNLNIRGRRGSLDDGVWEANIQN